jgi:site-specific recombinase XerD
MGTHRDNMDRQLRLQNYSPRTQTSYLRCMRRFVAFHMVSPERAKRLHIEEFLLHLREERGLSVASVKMYTAAIKFFYRRVLPMPELIADLPLPKVPYKRPEILTRNEVQALLAAAVTPKHHVLLSAAYACGLRVSEVVVLQTKDIDANANLVHVRHGKGDRHRVVMLGDKLLDTLRRYWRDARPKGPYFFEGRGQPHLSIRAAQHAVKRAASRAGIKRRVHFQTLRHSFATHMLERGVDIYTIQAAMGHKAQKTTRHYLTIRADHIANVPGLLDKV